MYIRQLQVEHQKNNKADFSKENLMSQEILFEQQEVIDCARIFNDEILIELDCEGIRVSEYDSLYFSYKVTNTSTKNLVLYNVQNLNFELESYKLFSFPKDTIIFYPKCKIHIIYDNNELPRGMFATTARSNEELPSDYALYSYVLIVSGESKIFNRTLYLGRFLLKVGDYKLRLEYYSPYYDETTEVFKREQRRNEKLKDYELFQGIVSSNACPFKLKVPIENPFLKSIYSDSIE